MLHVRERWGIDIYALKARIENAVAGVGND